MRTRLCVLGAFLLSLCSINSFAQALINEDFSTATGTTPPTGWANIDSTTSGEIWTFNNPGSRTLNAPITTPAAIFDSDNYGSGSAEDAYLETPAFDAATAVGTLFLSFDHYFRSGFGGSYEVQVYNGSAWTTVFSGSSSSTADPASESIDITTAAGASASAKVRFHWQGDYSWYWILDNVKVEAISCTAPTALGATNMTTSTADVYWTGGGATHFNVEYGMAGFTPGTGTVVASSNDTLTLSSLMAYTDYEFYVRDSCGVGNVSAYTGPGSFQTACGTPLSGVYTVDAGTPTGGTNYASLTEAANDLSSCGISAAVTLNIAAGTYTGSVYLDDIAGASATNTVTINGIDTSSTIITHDGSGQGATIWIDGADYVTISNLKIQNTGTSTTIWGILISDDSDNLTISNNKVQMEQTTSTSGKDCIGASGSATSAFTEVEFGDNLSILNNTLVGGTYGVHLESDNFGDTTTVISNNSVQSYYRGIFSDNTYDLTIENNTVDGIASSSSFYGIAIYDAIGFQVNGNNVTSSDYGMYLSDGNFDGRPAVFSRISNNMLYSDADEAFWGEDVELTEIYHNTFVAEASSTTAYGAYLNDLDSVKIFNNIFYSESGYSLYSSDADFTNPNVEVDYNIYYTNTGSNLAYVGGAESDLATWQTSDATRNANSLSGDPIFTGLPDLHLLGGLADGVATPIVGLTTDIDGDTRSLANPDIGADEYTPASCLFPTGLGLAARSATSADVYWTTGGASNWRVEYGAPGFTLGTGTQVSASNDTTTLSSLMANTSYDFYVKDSCSATSTSQWTGPVSFTTLPSAVTVPYTQDFETSAADFALSNGGDASVARDTFFCSGSNGLYFTGGSSSGWSGSSSATGTSATQAWVTNTTKHSEAVLNVDASAVAGSFLTLEFDLKQEYSYGPGYSWFRILVNGTQVSPDYQPSTQDADPCTRVSVDLSAYVGTSFGVTFQAAGKYDNARGSSGHGDNSIVDNISIFAPSCNAPSALGSFAVSASGASVYWTTGGASNWNVEYGVSGFTPGTGTVMAATNDTLVLGSLSAQTTYDFYVQDSCGVGNVSAFAGPASFTTPCAALTLPQLEDFSGGVPPTACWDEATSGTPATGPTGFGSSSWGDQGFGNVGSSGSAAINLYSTGRSDWLISPQYDLSGTTAPQLEFDFGVFAYSFGTTGSAPTMLGSDDTVEVFISTDAGTTYTSLRAFNNSYVTATGGNHEVIDLTAYVGSTVMFAIYGTDGSTSDSEDNDIFIDNFQVREAPACVDPTGLNAISATDTSVTIYWTGGSGNWNVQYGDTTGFVLGSGTVVAATNDTLTINGLSPSTTYVFYVQNDCGTGGLSTYVGPLQITTNCSVLPLPYIETFEVTTSTTLACVSAEANWALASVGGYGTSSNSLTFPFYNISSGVFSAFSPQFDPTPANYQLSFDHAKAAYTTEADSIKIYYSMDGGATYTLLVGLDGSATGALNTAGATTSQFTPGAADWSTFAMALPVGVNRIRIDAVTDYGNDVFLDNMSVDAMPTCGQVTGFGVDTVYGTTGVVYWTANANSIGTRVEYGPVGFTPGTGTVLNAQNDTLTINSLMANACYDVYIEDTCAGGILSGIQGPFTFCAACSGALVAPHFEGFETLGATIPNCWTTFSTTGEEWRFRSTNLGHSASTGANGSVHFAAFDDSENPVTTDGTLETPPIDVSPLSAPAISFYLWSDAEDASGVSAGFPLNATISVEVFDGAAWNMLFTRTGNTNGWEQFYVDLTGLTITGPIKARFIVDEDHGGGFDDDISIDDIFFTERPACFDPTNLAVTTIGLTSVGLSWDSDTTVNTSTIEYGAPGFALGTGTQVAGGAGMGTVSSLMSSTCYDFYVLDSCSGGFTSWLGPITVCTSAPCIVSTTPTGVNDSTGCGGGYVALSATAGNGNSDVAWIQNGIVVAVSDTVADTIAGTTVLQAHDYSASGVGVHVGPLPSIAAAGFGNFTNGQFITVHDTLYIDSTTVRSDGFVNAQVIIRDAAGVDILQRGTIFETPATGTVNTQVPVDILLVPGNYFIGIDFDVTAVSTGSLFRATGGAVYPYSAPGLLDITGVNFNGPRYYYTFDLVIRGACLGAPTQVIGYVPGATAGSDVTASICESEAAFNLASLVGPHTGGGTWTDLSATGALTDSIFDATVSGAGGPFNFRYVVSGAAGCANDTSLVTLNVDTLLNAGTNATAAFCTNSSAFVSLRPLIGADGGGTWADLDNSGILISDRIRPNQGTPGVYRFEYTQPANGTCPSTSATLTVTLSDPVDAGADDSDSTCISNAPIDLSTYLSAGATAGGTWIDVNGSGGLSGSIFTTSGVVGNTTYDFRYKVAGTPGCPDDSATVSIYVCDDVSLNEQVLSTVQLYPNPTNGVFFVEDADKSTQSLTVEVLSIDGKLLRSFELTNNGKQTVDITALAAGVYHVKVSTGKGVRVFKVIAQD